MATARKSGASRPKPKPAKVAVAKTAGKAAKPAPAKAAAKPVVKPAAKPAVKAAKNAAPAKAAVAKKPAPAPAPAKAKVVGKPAIAGKPAGKIVGKPAVAGKPAGKVVGKPAVAGKPTGKSVPMTKDAKGKPVAPAAGLKRTGKPVIRVVSHDPVASARPIGALPPEAVARAMKGHGPVANRMARPTRPTRDAKHPSGAEGVSEKDFKEFEQRLIAERQKIMKDMGYLESNVLKVNQRDSAGDLSGYSFHMADVGTDAYEREKAFLFASSEGRLLMDIDDALRKLYRGEYGRCEICEQPIARARLEAMPAARLCLACKEKQERENRGAQ